MHPNSTQYLKMVKQQHGDVQKNKKIHFMIKTRLLKLSQPHKNQTGSKLIQTAKQNTNLKAHILFHCYNCSKRK